MPVVCEPLEIVVIGNSTDYWPNFVTEIDEPTDDAWPALLGVELARLVPDVAVTVDNESALGAGYDGGLYGVPSMRDQLHPLLASEPDGRWLVIAPSVVDLQLRARDVDASFTAFERLLAEALPAFERVIVLPMNPVAEEFDPVIADAIVAFNTRLADGAYLADDYAVSPLVGVDGVTGRPEFYDDFDDGRADSPGPDPDFLHPDNDGHLAIARAMGAWLSGDLAARCR